MNTYRQAQIDDIQQILYVRHSVHENVLADPNNITSSMCEDFFKYSGRGWVCEAEQKIIGFSCANINDYSIWALFVLPQHEGKGIGKHLLNLATDWLFKVGATEIHLSTDTGTRAEQFYIAQGWQKGTLNEKNEINMTLSKK